MQVEDGQENLPNFEERAACFGHFLVDQVDGKAKTGGYQGSSSRNAHFTPRLLYTISKIYVYDPKIALYTGTGKTRSRSGKPLPHPRGKMTQTHVTLFTLASLGVSLFL